MSESVGDTWYRVELRRYAAPLDEFDNPTGSGRLALSLRTYKVTKVTPKGVWLDSYHFVLRDARKRFACPTKALAIESFEARKRKQLRILRSEIAAVEQALHLAQTDKFESQLPAGITVHLLEFT